MTWSRLYEVTKLVKLIETESRMVVPGVVQGWGGVGKQGIMFNGYRVSVLFDEKVLEFGCTTL